jgi:SHS2 domain-containing protein
MGRYEFLDDVALADCAIEIEGRSLDDLFETAAVALAHLMVDPATLTLTEERTVRLEAAEVDMLLHDWLSEMIFLKDRDSQVFPCARVRVTGNGLYRLAADVRGGTIDPERTALGADPKAVTFHQFVVEPVPGGWRARVVIDI